MAVRAVMPPTGRIGTSRGITARQALTIGRRDHLGGKGLEAVGAGAERGEGFRRRRDAGQARQAARLGRAR